jgi:hypothetical protein
MTIDVQRVAAQPEAPPVTPPPAAGSFDERWAAWEAKGAAHDRAFRRKMAIATPILLILAAVILYALGGR